MGTKNVVVKRLYNPQVGEQRLIICENRLYKTIE